MRQKGITKEWVQAVHPAKGGESKTADGVSFVEEAPPTAMGYKDYGNVERQDIMVQVFQNQVESEKGWLKPSTATGFSNGFVYQYPDMSDEETWDE